MITPVTQRGCDLVLTFITMRERGFTQHRSARPGRTGLMLAHTYLDTILLVQMYLPAD